MNSLGFGRILVLARASGPCYQVRMDIVAGEDSHEACAPGQGIPGFWLKVLQSHPEIEVW